MHDVRSEYDSQSEDGNESVIDGMATNFANNNGHIPDCDLRDDLKNIDLKPQQIEKTMKYRNSGTNRFVIPDNEISDTVSSEPNSEPSDIDHEELKKIYDEENERKMNNSDDPTYDNQKHNNSDNQPTDNEAIPIFKVPKDNTKDPVAD